MKPYKQLSKPENSKTPAFQDKARGRCISNIAFRARPSQFTGCRDTGEARTHNNHRGIEWNFLGKL